MSWQLALGRRSTLCREVHLGGSNNMGLGRKGMLGRIGRSRVLLAGSLRAWPARGIESNA